MTAGKALQRQPLVTI